ncbi:MAG: hypothetical protein J1D87_08210 [Lachnospiraceae bacterium]|nr:hypothetical protein [Lachnospiraceae bacterium]
MVKVYKDGAWEEITLARKYEDDAWQDAQSIKVYKNGAWEEVYLKDTPTDNVEGTFDLDIYISSNSFTSMLMSNKVEYNPNSRILHLYFNARAESIYIDVLSSNDSINMFEKAYFHIKGNNTGASIFLNCYPSSFKTYSLNNDKGETISLTSPLNSIAFSPNLTGSKYDNEFTIDLYTSKGCKPKVIKVNDFYYYF